MTTVRDVITSFRENPPAETDEDAYVRALSVIKHLLLQLQDEAVVVTYITMLLTLPIKLRLRVQRSVSGLSRRLDAFSEYTVFANNVNSCDVWAGLTEVNNVERKVLPDMGLEILISEDDLPIAELEELSS